MKSTVFIALAAQTLSTGQWDLTSGSDPMTARAETIAILSSEDNQLVVICRVRERPYLYVKSSFFLGAPSSTHEWRDFTYRFDDQPAEASRWKYQSDAIHIPSVGAMKTFIAKMANSKTLLVRATRYDRTIVDIRFDLSDPKNQFSAIRSGCGM